MTQTMYPQLKVPFFQHDLGKAELESLARVLVSPILTMGEPVAQFEEKFAEVLGRRHVLAVSSCTGALHLSLLALGIGPGDEVITTPMTFVASSTAILEAGARPVFVDVEPETGNLDANLIRRAVTSKTRAILPVHLYGQMCDMRAIHSIAQSENLKIIEDSAHSIESKRDGIRPGQVSQTSCYSFFATKNLTCGEGGALATDDTELYERLKLLRLHGMTKTAADRAREGYRHWDMVTLGWKYNMDNFHAAILLPQLSRLQFNLKKREELACKYMQVLSNIEEIRIPSVQPDSVHSRHLFPVWVPAKKRDQVIQQLQKDSIGVVVNYRAIHLLTYFQKLGGYKPGDFPVAEKIGDETISLPFYPNMPHEHVEIVAQSLKKGLL